MSQFTSASELLSQARSRITRYRPHAAAHAQTAGAIIVSDAARTATLTEMGFADVGDIDGGFRAWSAAGLPIEDR